MASSPNLEAQASPPQTVAGDACGSEAYEKSFAHAPPNAEQMVAALKRTLNKTGTSI